MKKLGKFSKSYPKETQAPKFSHNSLKPQRIDNSITHSSSTILEHKVWKPSSLLFNSNTDNKSWLKIPLKKKTRDHFHLCSK